MISVCMIVQDEEECLNRALDSIHDYVDEIIIIDGGSVDNTRDIALSYPKVKIHDIKFGDDDLAYTRQRNKAIELASNDWILILDADEYFEHYVGESLNKLIAYATENDVDAFIFSRQTFIDGKLKNIFQPDLKYRLFRNYCRFENKLHAEVVGWKKYKVTNLDIKHYKKAVWQDKDNKHYWDLGQSPPLGWQKVGNVWQWCPYKVKLSSIPTAACLYNEPLALHTSFNIGGKSAAFINVTNAEQIIDLIEWRNVTGVPIIIIGNGTNILVNDIGINGIVVKMASQSITCNNNIITVDAGVSINMLCAEAAKAGLTGLEFASGIPGTVGGGAVMNAGSEGSCFANVISEVNVIDSSGKMIVLKRSELDFGYRSNIYGYK